MCSPHYIRLNNGDNFPELSKSLPFKAIVIIEENTSVEWQAAASLWLVQQGCRYMMAWGIKCSTWDDSVDYANLQIFGTEQLQDDKLVMTTWHENETLKDVFIFSRNSALHPTLELNEILIIHISQNDKKKSFIEEYARASS